MVKSKEVKKRVKAYFLIVNLILASFAFCFAINSEIVSAPCDGTRCYLEQPTVKVADSTVKVADNTAKVADSTGTQKPEAEKTESIGKGDPVKLPVPDSYGAGAAAGASGLTAEQISSKISDAEDLVNQKNYDGATKVLESITKSKETSSAMDKFLAAKEKNDIDGMKTAIAEMKANAPKPGSPLSEWLLPETSYGTWVDSALTGVQWAAGAYMIGQLAGGLFGLDKNQKAALSTALAAGGFTWKFLATNRGGRGAEIFGKDGALSWLGEHPFVTGLGVAIVTFIMLYKKESKEIVTFTCKPWQAPVGGQDCEKCNNFDGCSEYKCRSLGQACQLLNAGTTDEKCAWVNPKDTSSPVISLWQEVLTKGYKYAPDNAIRPPARGFKIVKTSGDECVKAFTPLEFGITTNEPAQCRVDYNHTLKFDAMAFWFGESNLYSYNHSQKLSLPGPSALKAQAPEIENDGTYTLYIRCQDANGNSNVDEFALRFCVEKGPDTTPPEIAGTSIANNMPVKYNQTSVELEVYVNEPSDCKWSREDRSYDNMETNMSCNKNVWEMNNNLVYTCKTNLTGIKDRTDNVFYFRCKDQPWANESSRNANMQSYKFTLTGTETLNIIDIKPNGTIKGSTDVVSVNLEVETANGYKNGEAKCYYSDTNNEADWIEFFETGTSLHKQRLDLLAGSYKYYIKCVDLGGNRDDNSTEFKVEVDRQAPAIARAYKENELLKIITTEDSECRYSTQSCNFKFEDGVDMPYANQTSHVAEWKTDSTYYIRCSDKYGNIPVSNTCSMVVRAYDIAGQKVEEG